MERPLHLLPPAKRLKVAHTRPEQGYQPDVFFGKETAAKYHQQNVLVQQELTESAISLLRLGESNYNTYDVILDVGCGSGLSLKHIRSLLPSFVIGYDISRSMVAHAAQSLLHNEDIFLADCSQPIPLRTSLFDAVLSISVIQWLLTREAISLFLSEIYKCIKKDKKAIFQFYPKDPTHAELFVSIAREIGFQAFLIFDMPHRTPQKKWFLYVTKSSDPFLAPLIHKTCYLGLPYKGICLLCLKSHYDIPIRPPHDIALNNSKNTPMKFWLLRQHLILALQMSKGVSKKLIYDNPETKFIKEALQSYFTKENTFSHFYEKLDLVLLLLHHNIQQSQSNSDLQKKIEHFRVMSVNTQQTPKSEET